MILLSFGVRKSGSTLAFEMAKAVLELAGHRQVRLPDELVNPRQRPNFLPHLDDERLARLVDAAHSTQLAIKTHEPPNRLTARRLVSSLRAGELKVHVVFRDPRDTVLSLLDEAAAKPEKNKARTVDEAIERLRLQLRKLRRWGSFPSLKLRYEDFAFDPERGPRLIADDLGVDVDPAEVWRLVNASFTRKNIARPRRHLTMPAEDREKIEAAFPDYLRLVEDNDDSWFERTSLPVT